MFDKNAGMLPGTGATGRRVISSFTIENWYRGTFKSRTG
jgi:hypothetical protein